MCVHECFVVSRNVIKIKIVLGIYEIDTGNRIKFIEDITKLSNAQWHRFMI